MASDAPAPLLTSAEVQAILRCRPRTLSKYTHDGLLPVIKLNGKRRLYDARDVERFIAARRERGS